MKLLKIILLSNCFLMAASLLFSQQKNSLMLSAGPSIPVGSFTSSAIALGVQPGSTGTGFFADAMIRKNFGKSNFALGGLLGINTNGFDVVKVVELYETSQPGFKWSEESSSWLTAVAMPGICYDIPVANKLFVTAALYTGVGAVRSPSFTLIGVSPEIGFEANARMEQESSVAVSFAGRLAANVQFLVNEKIKLSVITGYSYLKPSFKIEQNSYENRGVIGSPERAISASHSESNFVQKISTLNAGIGLTVAL